MKKITENQEDLEESKERDSYDQPRKCRYYLRAYCKFGERCKFQHGRNEDRPRTDNKYSDTSREYNYRTNRNHHENRNRRRWKEYNNSHDQNSTWGRTGTNYDAEREIKRSFGNRGQWVKENQGHRNKVNRRQNTGSRYQQNTRQWDEMLHNSNKRNDETYDGRREAEKDKDNRSYKEREDKYFKNNQGYCAQQTTENPWTRYGYDQTVEDEENYQNNRTQDKGKFFRLTRKIPDLNIKKALHYIMEMVEDKKL